MVTQQCLLGTALLVWAVLCSRQCEAEAKKSEKCGFPVLNARSVWVAHDHTFLCRCNSFVFVTGPDNGSMLQS